MISAQSYIRTLAARADAAGASESMSDIMTVVGALQAIDEIDFSTAWSIVFGTEGRAHSVMRAPVLRNSSPSPRLPAPWSSVDSHVYAAYCRMPSNTYDGGTNYIVTTGVDSFLVSTGQGIAPWEHPKARSEFPNRESRRLVRLLVTTVSPIALTGVAGVHLTTRLSGHAGTC